MSILVGSFASSASNYLDGVGCRWIGFLERPTKLVVKKIALGAQDLNLEQSHLMMHVMRCFGPPLGQVS